MKNAKRMPFADLMGGEGEIEVVRLDLLRAVLASKGLSSGDLAGKFGVSQPVMSLILRGGRGLTREIVERMEAVLGCSLRQRIVTK